MEVAHNNELDHMIYIISISCFIVIELIYLVVCGGTQSELGHLNKMPYAILVIRSEISSKRSEYVQRMPHLHTADQPTAPRGRGRATEH